MATEITEPPSARTSTSSRPSTSSMTGLISSTKPLQPPALSYSLRTRKLAVAICWLVTLFDSVILALVLYYPLVYAAKLEMWIVMTVVTCVVGMITLFQFFWRTWELVRRKDWRRPIGSPRYALDMFHWVYLLGIVIVTLELVFGTLPDMPNIQLCSMPLATILFIAAAFDLIATTGYYLGLQSPIRISSLPRGEYFRPGVYTVIEDVIAVDGGAGLEYRLALDVRYRISPDFRNMLAKLSLFWSIPAMLVGAITTAIIWTTPDPISFGIGWCLPFIWFTLWGILTVPLTQHLLKIEYDNWLQKALESPI